MKISTTHNPIVLPLLAAGILVGVAEAASSGVRVHRIGDPPMLPRNFIISQPIAEAPADAPKAAPRRAEVSNAGRAVPMAPVGQEVGTAPIVAGSTAPAVRMATGQVPLAPVVGEPRPAMNYNRHIVPPVPGPEPDLMPVREADLPLAPSKVDFTSAEEELIIPEPPTPQPPVLRRSRLPLSPVGFVPAPKPVAPAAPVAAAPVAAPVAATPTALPIAPKEAPTVATAPAAQPVAAPAPAPKPIQRRRLPIAPVGNDPSNLPPVPANLVR